MRVLFAAPESQVAVSFALTPSPQGGHLGQRRSGPSTTKSSYQTQPPSNHRVLGCMGGLDAGWHGFGDLCTRPQSCADRTASEVGDQSHAGYGRLRWIGLVRALPGGMGTVVNLGPDRRPVWPHASAGRHHLRLRDLHWRRRDVANGVAVGIVPLAGGHRNWRRMGARGHVRRRSLAGRPPQDGRRISADWLLRGLLFGLGPQLHGGSALWLARHVLVRPDAGGRGLHGSAARERAGALATKSQGEGRRWAFFFAQNLQSSLHAAYAGEYGSAGRCHLRPVGGSGLRSDRDHQLGETCWDVAAAGRAHVVLWHGTAVAGNHPWLPGGPATGRALWP